MPLGYFEDLMVLTLDEVEQALKMARKQCHYWPSIAELRDFGRVEYREAERKAEQELQRSLHRQLPAARSEEDNDRGREEAKRILERLWPGYSTWNTTIEDGPKPPLN